MCFVRIGDKVDKLILLISTIVPLSSYNNQMASVKGIMFGRSAVAEKQFGA